MIDIFAVRYGGDRRGGDVVDPLVTDIAVAIMRGQNEIDASAPVDQVTLDLVYQQMSTGQLVEVSDADLGDSWRGKITGYAIAIEGAVVSSVVTVERPR